MVIIFPKESEAMVTLFHGEGNFLLLFSYTFTKPPELQEISVNLLNVVFYSVKRNINKSIWRWGLLLFVTMLILCNLLIISCQLSICRQNLNYFAHWQLPCCLCQLSHGKCWRWSPGHSTWNSSWDSIWIMCWGLKTWTLWYHHALKFGFAWVVIWVLRAWSMLGNGEIIAILDKICSLNDGWIGFVFLLKKRVNWHSYSSLNEFNRL